MTYEEAKKTLKRHCGGCMHPQQMGWCKSHCEIGIAIEALEKQIESEKVKCITCKNLVSNACIDCVHRVKYNDNYVKADYDTQTANSVIEEGNEGNEEQNDEDIHGSDEG